MRIIAGIHRGRNLKAPSGDRVRPTSDRVREALFSILGGMMEDLRVLDLFAGSGAFGLESLSRGAAHAVFVEKDTRVMGFLRENVATLHEDARVTLLQFDALMNEKRFLLLPGPFDIVFADPPYRLAQQVAPGAPLGDMLERLWSADLVAPGGIAVLEHDRRAVVAQAWEHFRISDTRTYGDTSLTFMKRREPE